MLKSHENDNTSVNLTENWLCAFWCTNRGVLGAGGDAAVVEGIPFDVQHVAPVARHSRLLRVHFTRLAKFKTQNMDIREKSQYFSSWKQKWNH